MKERKKRQAQIRAKQMRGILGFDFFVPARLRSTGHVQVFRICQSRQRSFNIASSIPLTFRSCTLGIHPNAKR